jgi:hypothetical protein
MENFFKTIIKLTIETIIAKHCLCYHKDRLNNSVSLSPSLCTKQSILFGQGNLTDTLYKRRQAMFGITSLGTNKDQLLHRIQSIRPSLIYNSVIKALKSV